MSLPAQDCQSPSGSQDAAQSPPQAEGNRTDCPKLLAPSCPNTHRPLSPLSLIPEQKKIMIIICCVILGIVIASTFGGIFG